MTPAWTSKICEPVGLSSKNTIGSAALVPATVPCVDVDPAKRYWPEPSTRPSLTKFVPPVNAEVVWLYVAPPLLRSSPEPSRTTPELPVVRLLMRPPAVRRQSFCSVPPPLTVSTPPTEASPVLVKDPTRLNAPAMVRVPPLVTVLPLRFTVPCTSMVPSFVTVTSGPNARPGASTTMVALARLITVITPLVLGWGRNRTLPSLSSTAPGPAAKAGMSAVPRTNDRDAPLMLLGWNAAPAATQIVPRFELTDPLKVSEAKSTTWVLSKLRSLGIPLASGYTAVGL